MTDEEAFFEVWFQLHRKKTFEAAPREPSDTLDKHPNWSMGLRSWMLEGWMARASLHVTPAQRSGEPHG